MPESSGKSPETRSEDARNPPHPSSAADTMIASDILMQGRREIVIVHDGLSYRLRITSNNKLILTK